MYRSRLGRKLDDVTLDYVSSLYDDRQIAIYDIIGSEAHVLMLYEKKIIAKKDAVKILTSLEGLKEKYSKYDEPEDLQAEDIHELIESLVIREIGKKSGGRMHTARSRNDQVSLDIRMKIRDDINTLCHCLLDAIDAMVTLARKHQKTIMPLYTHLQHAQAGVFSHYLLAHSDVLFRDLDRLYAIYGRVNQNPLGAGAVGGTSIPIDRHYTARLLGFKGLVENSIDATSSRDFIAEYVSAVAILMTNLSKISEDIILWSTSEFAFIELADEFASPSSVMPQKKNPDILEITRGKTAEVIGHLTAILSIIKGLPTGYGRDLQQMKSAVWSTSKTAINALLIFSSMFATLTVNEKKMLKSAEEGYIVALDIAEGLVTVCGVPFRTAHQISGCMVREAYKTKKPLSKLTSSEIASCTKGIKIDVQKIYEIVKSATIKSSLQKRISQGSSGFAEQERMIAHRTEKIKVYKSGTSKRTKELQTSLQKFQEQVQSLINAV